MLWDVSLLRSFMGRDDFHIRCIAHSINLGVKAAFQKIHGFIDLLNEEKALIV